MGGKSKKRAQDSSVRELKSLDEVHNDDVCWLGTRTSVSVGKRKLTMRSVGRSTTTTLNENTNVKLWCSFATKFFAMASFKKMQDLIFYAVLLISLTMKNFLCRLAFSSGKTPAFRTKIIQFSNWMKWPSPSVCKSLDLERETLWCDSCFPYKVYFLYIKDIYYLPYLITWK